MRSPVLLGAGAGVLVALLALLTAVTLVASTSLPVGDRAAGSPGGSGPAGATAPAVAAHPSVPAGDSSSGASGGTPAVTGSPAAGSAVPGASDAASRSGTPGRSSPSPSPLRVGTAVGDRAPSLVVDRLGGGTIDLATLRGGPVWVNFMASWCPPCRSELPLMEGYQTELGTRLTIVLVDVREARGTAAAFANALGITLPIGLDTAGRAQDAWGAFALPIHYWIDSSGVVRAVAFGSLGPAQFQANVQTVLPGVQLRS